jgi:hypothetical protein
VQLTHDEEQRWDPRDEHEQEHNRPEAPDKVARGVTWRGPNGLWGCRLPGEDVA